MKVYFVTHSTSKDNEVGLASGWKDIQLSQLGIQQARELGDRFENIDVDLICCSDLVRAVETVRIAFGKRIRVSIDK
ncbi:MAG: histidine phosphatase family protein, partial [Chloroflexi bacterium]|nr:histidine phosphatase family protein [Chloroflexota bacterium]